uniref:Acid proteinase n=1 Tax=Podospora anserina (strain S / ATCC MYA-4624 / DSM 980 / FGSC 10383) TaxID=515849 RepID=A0A090CE17_PODAN|nr:Putative acid proteinase [Podospora anserina S mat+]
MKSTTLLTTLSLASTALSTAIPLPIRTNTRPIRLLHKPPLSPPSQGARILSSQSEESTLGGAHLPSPPSGKVASVTATFTIPHASMPVTGPTANNTVGLYAASFHIGIDSFSALCPNNRFIRAGVDIFWDGTIGGEQTPWVWYQSSPADEDGMGFGNFSAKAGDVVRFVVTGSEVKVENYGNVTCTKGLKARQVGVQRVDGGGLCGGEAAWAVEDFPLAGMPDFPVALADFGGVVFKNLEVGFGNGTVRRNAEGAGVRDVRLAAQGGRLTDCVVGEGGGSVRCDRVVGE